MARQVGQGLGYSRQSIEISRRPQGTRGKVGEKSNALEGRMGGEAARKMSSAVLDVGGDEEERRLSEALESAPIGRKAGAGTSLVSRTG